MSRAPKYFAALYAVAMATAPAMAAEKPPSALSLKQYQACVADEENLQGQRKSLIARHRAQEEQSKQFEMDLATHVAAQSSVVKTDLDMVAAYNQRQDELNARSAQLNEASERLNREQSEFKQKIAAANARCNGMIFSFKDRDTINRENASGGKKH